MKASCSSFKSFLIDKKTQLLVGFFFLLVLCFHAYYWIHTLHSRLVLVFSFFIILIFLALSILLLFLVYRKERLNKSNILFFKNLGENYYLPFYAILLLVFGLITCALIPPGAAPDEIQHFNWSYQFANLLTGNTVYQQTSDALHESGVMYARACDSSLYQELPLRIHLNSDTYQFVREQLHTPCNPEPSTMPCDPLSIASALPQTRIASSIGIIVARWLGLNAIQLFYCGRLCNLLLFVIIVVIAIKVTPYGKPFFAAISLFPMTLQEAMSYSYDSIIIALSLLLVALFVRAITSTKLMSIKEMAVITVVSVLLIPCKTVYALIIFLAFLIPSNRFRSKKSHIMYLLSFFGVIVLCGLVLVLPNILGTINIVSAESAENHRGEATGVFYSISDFLRHPSTFVFLVLNTMVQFLDFYLKGIVCGSLGWLQKNIVSPDWLLFMYYILLFVSLMPTKKDSFIPSVCQRLASAAIIFAGVMTVFLSLATGWTFNTELVILGIQGRYLIPFVPLLFFVLRTDKIVIKPVKTKDGLFNFTLLAFGGLNAWLYIWVIGQAIMGHSFI